MGLENHMVVGPDDFDEVVECYHVGEMVVDRFNTRESVVRIRCLDCDAVFEGSVSEVTQLYLV